MDKALLQRAESAIAKALEVVDLEKRKMALFGSIAGKGTMADDLVRLFPEHKTYTEIFAGGAAVFWTKEKGASDLEVLNDYDSEVAFAYKFAQAITEDQIAQLRKKNWIGNKELFKRLRDSKPTNPVDRFYRFIYLRKAGFAKQETSCAPDKIGKPVASTLFDRLPQFKERLKGVHIYHGDFLRVLQKYDSSDTLHFMDPPFPGFKFNIGEGEWDEDRFLQAMYALKGKFILTYETRKELNAEFKKRGYKVREWLPRENRGFNPNQETRQKTTVVTNFEKGTTKSVAVPEQVGKKLTDAQRKEFETESELISTNKQKPENQAPHDFKAAKWTHPNGHPRCIRCGSEESISGRCNDPKADEAALKERGTIDLSKVDLSEMRGKTLRDLPDDELRLAWLRLNQWFGSLPDIKFTRDEILSAARSVAAEFGRRGFETSNTDLARAMRKFVVPTDPDPETRLQRAVGRLAKLVGIDAKAAQPGPAIKLSAEEIAQIADGRKTIIVDASRSHPAGKAVQLTDGSSAYGMIKLSEPSKIDLWKFAELTDRHLISDEERERRWAQRKQFWSYGIEEFSKFDDPIAADVVEIELADSEVDALQNARRLSGEWRRSIDGFVERQSRFLAGVQGSEETLGFIRSLPAIARDLETQLKQIQGGDVGKAEDRSAAVVIGRELLAALDSVADKLPESKIRTAVGRAVDALRRLDEISRGELLSDGGHFQPSEKRSTAEILDSGVRAGQEIQLSDVLQHVKPIVLRRNAVTLVGGIVNWGKSQNDVDVLIKGPIGEDLEHVMKFRLGRMMPDPINQRVQFLQDDDLGGPFTDHIELYDLWLVPRTHKVVDDPTAKAFGVIEMRDLLEKQKDDPLLDLPKSRGKHRAVYQYHFRGRSLHTDLRLQVNDHLVGWTIANQKADRVPSVATVRDARRLARRFDRDGSYFEKPWVAPSGLFATPKTRMPVAWLDMDDEVFEPGEIGATANEAGVLVRVTAPSLRVEFGLQKAWSHEYFFTGDPKFSGRLFFRLLRGRGGSPVEEDGGRVTPEGETFWRSFWTKDLLPSVLNRRSVRTKSMPPDGYSAIPVALEQVTPKEFRYWDHKGEDARKVRDDLVESKFFTAENVAVVGNEIRRVIHKTYLDLGNDRSVAKQGRVPYTVAWQYWKGQRVVRDAPSRQVWHLMFPAKGGGFHAWTLQSDPLSGAGQISGVYRSVKEGDLMNYEGAVDPGAKIGGEVLNESKATPSWIRRVDRGQIEILESGDGSFKIRFRGGKLRGTFSLEREEEGSEFWLLRSDGETTGGQKGASASLYAKRDGDLVFVSCPACKSVNVRSVGEQYVLQADASLHAIECNECLASFALDRGVTDVVDRNALIKSAPEIPDVLPYVHADPSDSYFTLKAVPVQDGVQVWDPDRKSPDADRSQLRPLAIYQPMKVPSRTSNEFRSRDEIESFATPTLLQMGIVVEPKYNGFRLSLQKRGGKVLIYTEDEKRDLSKTLPGLVADLRKLPGDFVLDGEGMAVDGDGNFIPRRDLAQFRGKKPVDDSGLKIPIFDTLYVSEGGNLTTKTQVERRRKLETLLRRAKADRFFISPFKIAKSKAELSAALDWAIRQPGSEGAMLKGVEATYSLGGENDLWAKFKSSRSLKAIVYKRDPVKDSPGVWTLFGAIGPVPAGDDRWSETVEVGGKRYVQIGKTFNTKLDADIGDAIEVEATEILLDRSGEKDRIRWFTPTVLGKADRAMTIEQVERLLQPGEVKKLVDLAVEKRISLVKTKEERFVFGIVLEPNDGKDGAPLDPDTQSDIYSAEAVRDAAHKFMERYGNTGVMHSEIANDRIKILESYVAPQELQITGPGGGVTKIRKGTWLLAVRVLCDKLWAKIKAGELTGFSIGGSALRIHETNQ